MLVAACPNGNSADQEQDIPKKIRGNTYANITSHEEFKKDINYKENS